MKIEIGRCSRMKKMPNVLCLKHTYFLILYFVVTIKCQQNIGNETKTTTTSTTTVATPIITTTTIATTTTTTPPPPRENSKCWFYSENFIETNGWRSENEGFSDVILTNNKSSHIVQNLRLDTGSKFLISVRGKDAFIEIGYKTQTVNKFYLSSIKVKNYEINTKFWRSYQMKINCFCTSFSLFIQNDKNETLLNNCSQSKTKFEQIILRSYQNSYWRFSKTFLWTENTKKVLKSKSFNITYAVKILYFVAEIYLCQKCRFSVWAATDKEFKNNLKEIKTTSYEEWENVSFNLSLPEEIIGEVNIFIKTIGGNHGTGDWSIRSLELKQEIPEEKSISLLYLLLLLLLLIPLICIMIVKYKKRKYFVTRKCVPVGQQKNVTSGCDGYKDIVSQLQKIVKDKQVSENQDYDEGYSKNYFDKQNVVRQPSYDEVNNSNSIKSSGMNIDYDDVIETNHLRSKKGSKKSDNILKYDDIVKRRIFNKEREQSDSSIENYDEVVSQGKESLKNQHPKRVKGLDEISMKAKRISAILQDDSEYVEADQINYINVGVNGISNGHPVYDEFVSIDPVDDTNSDYDLPYVGNKRNVPGIQSTDYDYPDI